LVGIDGGTLPAVHTPPQTQITIRVPDTWLTDAVTLAGQLSFGAPLARADVLRMALRAGLDALTHETARRPPRPRAKRPHTKTAR